MEEVVVQAMYQKIREVHHLGDDLYHMDDDHSHDIDVLHHVIVDHVDIPVIDPILQPHDHPILQLVPQHPTDIDLLAKRQQLMLNVNWRNFRKIQVRVDYVLPTSTTNFYIQIRVKNLIVKA